ncbi:MAG: endonuclease MutS2 [Armatimonadetes bacterium]|nr:endonuclease MutS2 [Armatimonadota bacterium]
MEHALAVLEWEKIVARLVEACETDLGKAQAAETVPSFDEEQVWRELEGTKEADTLRVAGRLPSLQGVRDVRGAVTIAAKGAVCDGQSLYRVGTSLRAMGSARKAVNDVEDAPLLQALAKELPDLPNLVVLIEKSLEADGMVLSDASPELAAARKRKTQAAQRSLERIQSYVSGKTRDWLSDPLHTVRNGRHVIPLKAEYKGRIKGIVHDSSASGQTVYVEPEDVVQAGNQFREAEVAEKAEEEKVLARISAAVGGEADAIKSGLVAATRLDVLFARARYGAELDGCVPTRGPDASIRLTKARHPLLDAKIAVPLSLNLGDENDTLLITGPNTGGKTVGIKTVGLAVAMAQAGMMVAAFECKFGCFTQIWADIGDEQSLQQSLSTFSGHIKNIAAALKGLRRGSLVLLDEVGAGTDPTEGASLARALLLAFQRGGAKTMASTHYGELKVLATNQSGFVNAAMEFDLKSLRPTYHLLLGTPGSSHALKIAERYGIPPDVVQEATEGIGDQALDVAKMIEKLEASQRLAQRAQGEADRLTNRLKQVEREAEAAIARADETRRRVREQSAQQLEEILREIRLETADVFESIKKDPSQANLDKARQKLKQVQEVGQSFVRDIRPEQAKQTPQAPREITQGMTVRVTGFEGKGIVLEQPKGKSVMVQMGALKMTVALDKLVPVETEAVKIQKRGTSMRLQRAQTVQREIHLRQMRAEDAVDVLEKFLDEAILAGVSSVRIVHGKGEGILRQVTQDVLRRNRAIRSHQLADATEGGEGVTVAQLQ